MAESENTVEPGLIGSAEWKSAIVRLVVSLGTFVVVVLVSYLIPQAESFRPWVPGDDAPLKKVFLFQGRTGESAAASSETESALTGDLAVASLASNLGSDLAANLGEAAGVDQSPVGANHDREGESLLIDKAELEGLVKHIEDPSGRAMASFYKSLYETAKGQKVSRVAHWGDSTIAADDVTGTLRRRLQKRFGDSGHGFMLVGKGTMPYRHKDVKTAQEGPWTFNSIIRDELGDGLYGYGGVVFSSSGGGSAYYQTVDSGPIGRSVTSFEVFYQKSKGGGAFSVAVDSGKPELVQTGTAGQADNAGTDGFFKIDVARGSHRLDLRAEGPVRLFGVAMEDSAPGVVYDSLGIVGARASRMLNANPQHFKSQVEHRAPDLLVIAFGGNESGDRGMNFDTYRDTLRKAVAAIRAGRPEASCLLLAPLDQGEVGPRGKVRTIPTIPKIVKVQREVAASEGCAFFDTFSAMGGDGAMGRWYKSKPRLGWGDYRHATPAGYEIVGNMIYKGLMAGFVDYLVSAGLGGLAGSETEKQPGSKTAPVK